MTRSYDISTRFTYSGWFEGSECDPEEPGKEWLAIEDEGEELAILVLRTDASIFENDPDALARARSSRETDAKMIVNALNRQEESQ